MLNFDSPIPLYRQLADLLTAQIRSRVYPPGVRIASEHQLAAEHGIGRPTIRQAIDLMVRRGLVVRRRGSGTYVCEPRQEVDLFSLDGTSASFHKKGVAVSSQLSNPVALRVISGSEENPFNGSRAYCFSRVTMAAASPVLVESFYLHPDLFAGIERFDLAGQSLSAIAEEQFYLRPIGGKQSFRIDFVEGDTARRLELPDGSPVLMVHRWLDFARIKQGVYAELWCRTDRFIFTQTIGGNPDV